MRHFHSREEYLEALDARLDDFEPDMPIGEIARTSVVTWRGEPGLLTLETVEPDLRWGWSPFGILEQSRTDPADVLPEHAREEYVSISSAAYYVLIEDLAAMRAERAETRQ